MPNITPEEYKILRSILSAARDVLEQVETEGVGSCANPQHPTQDGDCGYEDCLACTVPRTRHEICTEIHKLDMEYGIETRTGLPK